MNESLRLRELIDKTACRHCLTSLELSKYVCLVKLRLHFQDISAALEGGLRISFAFETTTHSGLSQCISILPFLEEGQPLKEPMFVLGSEHYERTFFAGFPPLAQHKSDEPFS